MKILLAIAWKEYLHIKRDPKTLAFIIVMPIMLLIIYGYGIKFDVEDIKVSVVDYDRTPDSRAFTDSLTANPYFRLISFRDNADQLFEDLNYRRALVGVVIPRGYAKDLALPGTPAQVQFLIDGSDGNTATIAYGYLVNLTNQLNMDRLKLVINDLAGMPIAVPPVDLQSRYLYNPDLESTNFIVPGIIAIILMIIGPVATTLTIVREKENNTIEQLVVSRASSTQIVLGKLVPYIVLSCIAVVLVIVAAVFLFNLQIKGSLIELALMTLVYLVGVLGIGIWVSSLFSSMAPAMLASMMITMLPSIILSGFVFPIRNMPEILQWLSTVVPARYFIIIMRGIYLKGVGIEVLWPQLLFIGIFGLVVFTFSIALFRKRLD